MHPAGRVALPKNQGVSLAECGTVNVEGAPMMLELNKN
jgi:hypothetical protein